MTTTKMSMSDIDGFVRMYHAGELTTNETQMLTAILRRLSWTHLLDRANYEALTGATIGAELPSQVNLRTGEVA